jgi:beta-glucosidase
MPLDYTAPHTPIYAQDPASKPILLDGALEGHVLVKNENALPLKSPKLLSIFGYDAVAPLDMDIPGPSDLLDPFTYGYESLPDLNAFFTGGAAPAIAINGTIISGGKAFHIIVFHLTTFSRHKY